MSASIEIDEYRVSVEAFCCQESLKGLLNEKKKLSSSVDIGIPGKRALLSSCVNFMGFYGGLCIFNNI